MSLPKHVTLTEVGPRDGLQNEAQAIPTAIKIELCQRLLVAGVASIEVGAFVSPKWVPQMADSAEVFAGVLAAQKMSAKKTNPSVRYAALTPNLQGFENALAAGANEVVIFGAASETFSQKNIHCSIAESIARFKPVANAAQQHQVRLRASISCALGCPYEGLIAIQKIVEVVKQFRDLGCVEIGIADTIGVGTPNHSIEVFSAAAREYPLAQISGHFHDTYGQALANIYACLQMGVQHFDSSVAGLGGCPYAQGATGNVATEDVLYLLAGLGIDTGIDLTAVVNIGQWISQQLGRPAHSRAGNALAKRKQE